MCRMMTKSQRRHRVTETEAFSGSKHVHRGDTTRTPSSDSSWAVPYRMRQRCSERVAIRYFRWSSSIPRSSSASFFRCLGDFQLSPRPPSSTGRFSSTMPTFSLQAFSLRTVQSWWRSLVVKVIDRISYRELVTVWKAVLYIYRFLVGTV